MNGAAEYEVAIVGCGPVGALAANLFGKAGLRTVVLERETSPYPLPRAVHIDHEMMRLFQSVGLADTLLAGMREAQGHIHIGADGGVIRYLGSAGLPKRFGWANDYFFYQPELEQALRNGAARFPNVTMAYGTPVLGLEQSADKVVLSRQGGGAIRAQYVIACDGAASFVRKALGIALVDLQFDEPWLVVDAEVRGPIRLPEFSGVPAGADLQHLSIMLCDPRRPATLVPGRGGHRRWEFMLLPGEDDEAMMQPARVRELIAPYVAGTPHTIIRAATYRFHGLIAERWQEGRIFLAGDAAHQTPPFFGQGMCHGMRDVANLAWKLHAVVRRGAAPALLETYEAERAPHVGAVIEAAIAAGRYICELDPEKARRRDETLRAAMGSPAPKSASDLIPPIAAGLIDGEHRPGTGARFIQPYVELEGKRMLLDDATGGGWALLASSGQTLSQLTPAARSAFAALGGRSFAIDETASDDAAFRDVDGDLVAWFAQHGATAVLLRPDFYVYGVAQDAEDAARLVVLAAKLAARCAPAAT
jgi:3-(3-hydroxy-phenyl)propionate hydroxylase